MAQNAVTSSFLQQAEAPDVEDIIGIVRIATQVVEKDGKRESEYATPPFHYMVSVKKSTLTNNEMYECACLELGMFHVISKPANNNQKDKKTTIETLIDEMQDLVAEYIRVNIFDFNNNSILQDICTDFMNEYWKVYRVYTLLQANSPLITHKILQEQKQAALETLVNPTPVPNKPTSKYDPLVKIA